MSIYSLCKCSKKVIVFPFPFSSSVLGRRLSEVCFGLTVRITVFPVVLGMLMGRTPMLMCWNLCLCEDHFTLENPNYEA